MSNPPFSLRAGAVAEASDAFGGRPSVVHRGGSLAGTFLRGLALLVMFIVVSPAGAAGERNPWTQGRVTGSPDPPPPFRTSPRFPQLRFARPLLVRSDPAGLRIWICEQEGRVYSFPDDRNVSRSDLFLDLRQQFAELRPHPTATEVSALYGLAFHPDYPQVPYCWLTYTLAGNRQQQHLDDGTRLSRFRVDFDESGIPRCDVASETVLLTWLEGGHNGGCLEFGPDGMLYVSTGDGEVPNPPDPRLAGQDVTNLLSTILRIEASVDESGPPYSVPADNPFVDLPAARPEIWAFGFRNPWKMTFAPGGDLWCGDVGWELYEMVYRVERGGNYGWSIMEGPQPVRPDGKRGPTPILPAAVALRHSDAASVTGGYVYRGTSFPELQGLYIFGDYETRRIWSAVPKGNRLTDLHDLVQPTVRLVAFGEDTRGELLLLDHDDGAIYELLRNDVESGQHAFPVRLSETGIFADTAELTPAPGVLPFDINVPMWNDGAKALRHVAVPGNDAVIPLHHQTRRQIGMLREWMTFPKDSVLARTVTLADDRGAACRLETQLLHFDGTNWAGYSYVWNPEQTDALLAPAAGATLELAQYGTFTERSSWQVQARAECLRCHNHWSGGSLAFVLPQLSRTTSGSGTDQVAEFCELGLFPESATDVIRSQATSPAAALTDPANDSADLDLRARSYLSVNCSHCHQNGAGGTATIDLRHGIARGAMQAVDVVPVQGRFSLLDPAIIVPGIPDRSVLLYRMCCSGRGRMPHIGSSQVDADGVRLIREWIAQMPVSNESPVLDEAAVDGPVVIPNTSVAMRLVSALEQDALPPERRDELLTLTREAPEEISGLFTRFQPAEFRRSEMTAIDSAAVLETAGEAQAGGVLFRDRRLQCATCHRIGQTGGQVGPELDDLGIRLSRAEILDSMLDPSKKIDPKYTAWTAVTHQGAVVAGLLVERSEAQIVLRTAKPEDVTISRNDLAELFPQTVSLMPDRLLNGLDTQEIADLLAYLASRR